MRFEFRTFGAFYMVAFVIDATEEWDHPLLAAISVVAVALIYLRGVRRWDFFAFLIASSAYILAVHFPDPGNHNNLYLLVNVFLIAAILWASLHPQEVPNDAELLERVKPTLRLTMSLVYIFAGFAKLNSGFFVDDVGCAATFFDGLRSQLPIPAFTPSGPLLIVFGSAIIFWELGGGVMLWFRKTQPIMLVLALAGHTALSFLVFVDFSSVAFAMLLTFIPLAYWRIIEGDPAQISWGGLRLDRPSAYVLINLALAVAAGVLILFTGVTNRVHQLQGLGLISATAVFIWPILAHRIRARPPVPWTGVPIWRPWRSPRWAVALPVFIVFFGLNPYLGLRTAGTFTMFSNLQITGDSSNHFLMGDMPLKIWNLSGDLVHVRKIDPRNAKQEKDDLNGNSIPVLEFQKRIVDWGDHGLDNLYATYVYDGHVYKTKDIVEDNAWDIHGYRFVHYLVDFRLVQEKGPVECRW